MALKPIQKDVLFDNDKSDAGAIIRKPGSRNLYVLFMYLGRRVEKSTGIKDTPENRDQAREVLDTLLSDLRNRKRTFAQAFPGASDAEKTIFAQLEGWTYTPPPNDVLIGDYINEWLVKVVAKYDHGKKFDYQQITKCWILPYFSQKTFLQFTKYELKAFVLSLKCKIGPNKGETLSKSRVKNILTILRTLYDDAVSQHQWELPDPFHKVHKLYPKKPAKRRGIFRFHEWLQILEAIDPWYRPMLEFMMLTGAIHSEVSGLRRGDIETNHISLHQSIVRKVENDWLKTPYRTRKVPLTTRLRAILEETLTRTTSEYVFAERDGSPCLRENFTEPYWIPAVTSTGIPYRSPYSIRHSFAAYCLLIGIPPLQLVSLMGHSSKKMVYDVYGNYLDGIEEDAPKILEFFGRDFVEGKKKPPLLLQTL